MGMSASQARYLGLIARQNDLEYQGQQINQERTVLSQQVTDLYNTLQNMTVPTPPSTTDYTTIQYSGSIGATSYTFDASTIKPSSNKDNYIITVYQDGVGDSIEKNTAIANVKNNTSGNITLAPVSEDSIGGAISKTDISKYYVLENASSNTVRPATENDFTIDSDGKYVFKSGVKYLTTPAAGEGSSYTMKGSITGTDNKTVSGQPIFTLDSAVEAGIIDASQKSRFEAAIQNAGITAPNGDTYTANDFYMYFDGNKVNFALKSDVDDGNDNAVTYTYVTGCIMKFPVTYDDCTIEFDSTTGRITEIGIPSYDKNGEVTSRTSMKVQAKTVTDENAYQDAYAQYEYKKYEYDKTQQEINAKTEVIQQEDKRLELKLQRLDNERTQITTEIEAVDKVINDNIEASYKTFSG